MAGNVEIVTLGYIFNEHICAADGTITGPFLGGTESFGAIGLARAGYPTGAVTNIGPNLESELRDPFLRAGVDLRGFQVYRDSSETKDLLCYFPDGTKEIRYLTRAPRILPHDVPEDYLNTMKVAVLCLVDYEVDTETIMYIKEKCPGLIISADLGGAGGAHSTPEWRNAYIKDNGGQRQKELMALLDITKMSYEDYECITGKNNVCWREAAQDILDQGPRIAILTLGKEGSYIRTSTGEEYHIEAVPAYNGVVDTTGAGDTYICIFTAEYVRTGDIETAAYFASATSSILIEKTGGASPDRCPSRDMIERRLERYWAEKNV